MSDSEAPALTGVAGPVSTLVTREVPADHVAEFERTLHDVLAAARTYSGHLGVDVLRPDAGGTYRILFRFRDEQSLQAWLQSDIRRDLVDRADRTLNSPPVGETRSVDGWEGWFIAPGYAPPTPPRRWKMALLTLCGIYPLVLLLAYVLGPVTVSWPRAASLLLSLAITTTAMTWAVMPIFTRTFGHWLRHR